MDRESFLRKLKYRQVSAGCARLPDGRFMFVVVLDGYVDCRGWALLKDPRPGLFCETRALPGCVGRSVNLGIHDWCG